MRQTKALRDAQVLIDAAESSKREHDLLVAAARRLQKLHEATTALVEARAVSDVAEVATRVGAEALNASSAIMWMATTDTTVTLAGSHNIPADYLELWRAFPIDTPLPIGRVFANCEELWVENESDYAREAPQAIEHARRANRAWAFAVLPLQSKGKAIAAIVFSYQGEHRFTADEKTFVRALARSCEQALDRARLFQMEAEARKAAEAAAAQKDEFLAMLGHELRNPLFAISTAMQVIQLREPFLNRELTVVDRQVAHLTHIVTGLVDVTRLTQGSITLRREPVDFAESLASAIDIARPLIEGRQHELVLRVPKNIVLDADRHRLAQVLANLLTNAAKYTASGGRIELSVDELDGGRVQISVRDNGRGIQASLLPHLFKPLVQGQRPLDRSDGGLGIGLTLVKLLVDLHGATIEVASDGVDMGSTFTLRWPRPSRHEHAGLPMEQEPQTPLRVLITDDNEDAANMLSEIVRACVRP